MTTLTPRITDVKVVVATVAYRQGRVLSGADDSQSGRVLSVHRERPGARPKHAEGGTGGPYNFIPTT